MEELLPVCRGCRHPFVVDFRNRSRTKHPQVYCGKPACQEKSQLVSWRTYRKKSREDADQVLARVRRFRKKRSHPNDPDSHPSTESRRGPAAPSTEAGRDLVDVSDSHGAVDKLAHRIEQVSGLLAALIVNGTCNATTGSDGAAHPEP